jgi:lysophospholipase L1-like esterase
VYEDEVRHYENLYGLAAMEENWRLYFSTDGCHPNRAGMSLVADALAETVVIGAPGD